MSMGLGALGGKVLLRPTDATRHDLTIATTWVLPAPVSLAGSSVVSAHASLSVEVRLHVSGGADVGSAPTLTETPTLTTMLPEHKALDVAPDAPDRLPGEAAPAPLVHAVLQEDLFALSVVIASQVVSRQ